jgi:hypothetical protein
MLSWIIQITIVSIILIFLVHHLINFFKTTLTVPKIKDLVKSPGEKYKDIFETINQHNQRINTNVSYTDIELLPTTNTNTNTETNTNTNTNMKDELKLFLKKQMKQTF